MTKEHVQLLLGRVGEGSALWINGDFKQCDAEVFRKNSGLMVAVDILINFHLEGMVGEIVNLRDGNIENARELVYLAFLVICEQLIVSSQAQVDFLHVLQSLSPPS